MATLAKDTPVTRSPSGGDIVGKFEATALIYDGAVVIEDGTLAEGVKHHAATTAGFKGIALTGASASGEMVEVLEDGYVVTSLAATVAAGGEGATVYAVANSTNLADANLTSTSNLPIGKIARVLTAGTTGANLVVVKVQGDGHVSR